MKPLVFSVISLMLGCAAPIASAAVIDWTVQSITHHTNVDTRGTLLYAGARAGTTVNGVTFTHYGHPSTDTFIIGSGEGSIAITPPTGGWNSTSVFGAESGVYAGLDATYRTLLGSGYFGSGTVSDGAQMTLTLSNLVVGQAYLIQFFINDSRGHDQAYGRHLNILANDGPLTMTFNTQATLGGLGSHAIGRFIADSTTQSFSIAAYKGATAYSPTFSFNALQVRSIPEPGAFSLLALTIGVSAIFKRRRSLLP